MNITPLGKVVLKMIIGTLCLCVFLAGLSLVCNAGSTLYKFVYTITHHGEAPPEEVSSEIPPTDDDPDNTYGTVPYTPESMNLAEFKVNGPGFTYSDTPTVDMNGSTHDYRLPAYEPRSYTFVIPEEYEFSSLNFGLFLNPCDEDSPGRARVVIENAETGEKLFTSNEISSSTVAQECHVDITDVRRLHVGIEAVSGPTIDDSLILLTDGFILS